VLNNFHEVVIFKEFMLKINLYGLFLNIKNVLFSSRIYDSHLVWSCCSWSCYKSWC